MSLPRWDSLYACLETLSGFSEFETVLELGPGGGLLGAILTHQGYKYRSFDVADDVNATFVGDFLESSHQLPISDCVVACQVLEHLPYEQSFKYLHAMADIARKYLVISVPNLETIYSLTITLPRRKVCRLNVRKPIFRRKNFQFNGEHYWELGCSEVSVNRFISDLEVLPGWNLTKNFRVPQNPYHHFFVLEKRS